jgi:SOS-response transcriptional repressor LexA
MLKSLIPYWQVLFSENSLDKFLKEVIESFDDDEITDNAVRQLHRYTQLNDLKLKGILGNDEYIRKLAEISDASERILKQISENYLPILPIKAVAGHESGPHYTVEYHDIEDWKYLSKKNAKKKVGIRVDGESMNPLYSDGDILMCKKTVIEDVSEREAVIIVRRDNSIYLKYIKKEGSVLHMISLNPEFEKFDLHLSEVLEIWKVETKVK